MITSSPLSANHRLRELREGLPPAQRTQLDDVIAEVAAHAQLLERVFNSPRTMIAYLDADFTFRRVNAAYAAADEKDTSYYPGKNHFDLFPNEENEAIFEEVVRTGVPHVEYEKPFEYAEHPERGTTWWDWTVQPVFEDDKVDGVVLMLTNVTDRVLARREVEHAEAQYAALARVVPAGVFHTDAEGRCTYVNPYWLALSGMTEADAYGHGWVAAVHPDDRDAVTTEWYAAVAEGRPFLMDYRFQQPDGTVVWLQGQASAERGPTGELLGWVGACVDITARKAMEEKLRSSERSLEDAQRIAHLGNWDWDVVGGTLAWSDEIYRIFGIAPQAFGATYEAFIESVHPDDRAVVIAGVDAALAGHQDYDIEHRIVLPDGTVRYVHERGVVARADDGTPIRMQGIVHDNTEHVLGEVRLTRVNKALRTLSRCNEVLVHATSEEQLLADMCQTVVEQGGYCFSWVGFKEDDAERTVRPIAFHGREEGFLRSTVSWTDDPRGHGPVGTAVREGTTQLVCDTMTDPRYTLWRDEAVARGYGSVLALPLRLGHEVIGALGIYADETNAFDDAELDLLTELANDLAFGIGRQRDLARIARSVEGTLAAVGGLVEIRDPYTAGHQRRVAELADEIARRMGLPEHEVDIIRIAGLVHDVGKIYVPAEILTRPGELSETEFELIRQHPQKGYDILLPIDFGGPVAEITLQHHERLDGSGYPRGLRGDDILLAAQILAVADVTEAITHFRPYRPALGLEVAVDELLSGHGTHFNPTAVDLCIELVRELDW